MNFLDADSMSELRNRSVLERCVLPWLGTIKTELAILNLEVTRTWDFGNASEEVELGGAPSDIHAKDDTYGRYQALQNAIGSPGSTDGRR